MPVRVATVRAADVPATQTDFPIFVDLGRVGVTALTLAEAQSSRWYTDTDLVTQMAREIVSLTEGHGKYGSLTSTSKIAIDYDGIRADYAVTDTFGRNNVWTGYASVWHLQETSGTRTDSKAGTNNLADINTVTSTAGNINTAAEFNSANSETLSIADASQTGLEGMTELSISFWMRYTGGTTYPTPISKWQDNTTNRQYNITIVSGAFRFYAAVAGGGNSEWESLTSAAISTSTTYYVNATLKAGTNNHKIYLNGVLSTERTFGLTLPISNRSAEFRLGSAQFFAGVAEQFLTGWMDETRVSSTAPSANWITTEYNNQNAESTFWGTWTTSGGGATPSYFTMLGVG